MISKAADSMSPSEMNLPKGFITIEHALASIPGKSINVIGFVKDFQPPIQTRGTDAKSTITLTDPSILDNAPGIKLVFFSKMERQVNNIGVSDLIFVRGVKVQNAMGNISLITSRAPITEIHILKSSDIPRDFRYTTQLPWITTSPYPKSPYSIPSSVEMTYAVWAFGKADDMYLPTEQEFQEKTVRAINIKDKFSLLKDVRAGQDNQSAGYYDLVGQVVKVFQTSQGWMDIQFTDYTSNSLFYDHVYQERAADSENSDPCGHGNKSVDDSDNHAWKGPYGKLSISITIFYADIMHADEWLLLKNVKIVKSDSGTLKGKLNWDSGRIVVEALDPTKEPLDPRLKETLERKRDYWKRFDHKSKQKSSQIAGQKRNSENDPPILNAKERRKRLREAGEKKASEKDSKVIRALGLNENVRCSYPEQPIVSISEILQPETLVQGDGKEVIWAPFTARKYRANVRVVDYFPHRIEDFAVARQSTEYDLLSDHSGGDDTDAEDDRQYVNRGRGATTIVWEWRFALQVEDATAKENGHRLWLLVDNPQAQGLLGLEDDAMNLRKNPQLLQGLREQLFHLWGDLEERIAAKLPPEEEEQPPPSTDDSFLSTNPTNHRAGDQPDADDSDDETENIAKIMNSEIPRNEASMQSSTEPVTLHVTEFKEKSTEVPKNKPFTCCIQQYGIQIQEKDRFMANAGDGKRWQRVFSIHGTTIPR